MARDPCLEDTLKTTNAVINALGYVYYEGDVVWELALFRRVLFTCHLRRRRGRNVMLITLILCSGWEGGGRWRHLRAGGGTTGNFLLHDARRKTTGFLLSCFRDCFGHRRPQVTSQLIKSIPRSLNRWSCKINPG
ncbi:hypothetical protein Zmor_020008 [Zophobas morio]|uniref:Uncharacterized protein n=1 Tax=Zophobas morio TaxID=2755281 RepID=A0AA38M9X4_9CUCU|nr:hypothetical protein Zmor_020008 [Zophobas morio]